MFLKLIYLNLITLLVFLSASTLAWSQDSPSAQDYMQSAQNALQENDVTRAIQDYIQAIKIDPRNWEAYQNLGGCYVQLRKMDYAKLCYQRSLKINPNNPGLIAFMAQIWGNNPTPTPTPAPMITLPTLVAPSPTPTFQGVLMNMATPTMTPTFMGILMNTATPTMTPTPTATTPPFRHEVEVPFIDVTTPTVLKNGQVIGAPTPVPHFKGFKPYVFQGLPRYNLPEKDTLTLDIGGAVWFGSAQNVNDYFGPNLSPTANAPTAEEADLGLDYALLNEFQLGLHLEGLVTPSLQSQINGMVSGISNPSPFVNWDSYAVGMALSGKYLIPLNNAMSLVAHLEGGYYTLIGSDITYNDGNSGTVDLSGSAFGGLAALELELFQVEDKSLALDFGLGYRFLRFNNLTGSGTIGTTTISGPVLNANGTPAYSDYSGPRVSMSIRFIH